MTYKKIEIDGKAVYKCIGDGQCVCQRCRWNGKPSINWTCFMYQLKPTDDAPAYCINCIEEILKE